MTEINDEHCLLKMTKREGRGWLCLDCFLDGERRKCRANRIAIDKYIAVVQIYA